jgi:hypothetical protein
MNGLSVQKEIIMKFDGSFRGPQGTEYQQFSSFLEMNRRKNRVAPAFSSCTQENEAISRGKSLAMVYPEKQEFKKIYDPEIALINGTIFEELNLPFNRSKCSKNGGCFR